MTKRKEAPPRLTNRRNRATGDRRSGDKVWREKFSGKVTTLEMNQNEMFGMLKRLTAMTESIAEDTSMQRDLTRCARGVARFILWGATRISSVAVVINKIMKPLLVLLGFTVIFMAAGIALFNHGKLPEWALPIIRFLVG